MKVGREAMLCLGTRIKIARKQKGLTQEQLAEVIGVSRSAISRWESGDMEPTIKNLAELARTLDVSSDHLLGLDESRTDRSVLDRLSPTAEKALDLLIREIANAVKRENKY